MHQKKLFRTCCSNLWKCYVSIQKVSAAINPAHRLLLSANFSLKKKDDIYYLRVRGSGHGVGFSQFGGNEMAKNGSSAEEILKKYFPEMELKAED